MSQPKQSKQIFRKIMIKPKYMNNSKYIKELVMDLEGKCDNSGYIDKIYSIDKVLFDKFYEQSFSGSILLNINFTADIVSIEKDDIIQCKVIKANEDGIVAEGTYPIFVIIDGDYEKLSFLNVDDMIKVKILKWDISREKNLIRAVGRYIEDKEMEIIKDNNE